MQKNVYSPPWFLRNGLLMTLYVALKASHSWEKTIAISEPPYQEHIFTTVGGIKIYGWIAIPPQAHSTIVGTYGITGDLENQWFLKTLGRKAYDQGYAVILFDWRAHGKTAELSPTLTSDGIEEGKDFIHIAAQGKKMGCPTPFWFTGYSLGGQLALWGIKYAQEDWVEELGLKETDIAGGAVICPNLDSNRSLTYLSQDPFGKHLDRAIAKNLKKLALNIYHNHPGSLELAAIERANTIRAFDHELVIKSLGFKEVEAYYKASSPLPFLETLSKRTLIIYAADDPLFDVAIVKDLEVACAKNPKIDLLLTPYGGHVGYISSKACQKQEEDPDIWWAWNRVLEWLR